MTSKWISRLLIVLVCCLFSFGGTFTCTSDQSSDDFTANPSTPAK